MRLVIEGWRFLPHSYSVVNRALCLELSRRGDVELFHRDVPYIKPTVVPDPAGFGDDEATARLAQLPALPAGHPVDATLRLFAPLDLRPAATGRTLVFGTAEFGRVDPRMLGGASLQALNHCSGLALLTPSEWSRSGLVRGGADPDKIAVIPHGFDPELFQPANPQERTALRQRLGWEGTFVFLNVGALTANKGIIHLLKAFATLTAEFPEARLVLKGLDALYSSTASLNEYRRALTPAELAKVEPRLIYLNQTLTSVETAALYRAADAYVSPYHAEGFNLPVLEAAACGLPIVCTAGGPTDDFTQESFALRIHGRLVPAQVDGIPGAVELAPDETHLAVLLRRLLTEPDLASRCRLAGPAYVSARFTWKQVTDQLLELLAAPQALCWEARPMQPRGVTALPSLSAAVQESYNRACQHYSAGNKPEAEKLCRQILRQEPLQPDAIYLLGALALDEGRADEALLRFHHATVLRPESAPFHNALGEAFRAAGRNGDATESFHTALKLDPGFATAHNALGQLLLDGGFADAAAVSFRSALTCKPDYERAYLNLGRALQSLGELAEAESAYLAALRLRPGYTIARNNLGAVLLVQGRSAEAAAQLREALRLQPDYPEAHCNLGNALHALGDPAAARVHFQSALQHRPDYVRAHHGLGRSLEALGEFHAALACFRESVRLKADYVEGYESLGDLLLLQPDWEGALAALERASELQPQNTHAFSRLVYTRQLLCDWSRRDADFSRLWDDAARELEAGKPAPVSPLAALMVPWSADRQLAIARSHSQAIWKNAEPLRQSLGNSPATIQGGANNRLRIGYLSNEFRDHAVSHLMQGVFGLHERREFEIFAYSFGPDDGSSYRQRIVREVDHFRDLRGISVTDCARRIQADGIQILVDLQTYSGFPRMSLMSLRPAPIQANYLGYPGTTGADFMDYLIGDPLVTPAADARHYQERLAILPHCYLPTDHQQPIAATAGNRAAHGLPEQDVVFCAFNNSYKIEPQVWDIWCRILTQVPGSILWLTPSAPRVEQNLRQEAAARGIAGNRLVFARRLPNKGEHLRRHDLADLFLDTLYYNGHTTACDALWGGLPMLTCPGETFASRVGASLLTAVGLPELIAVDRKQYEQRAVELAHDRAQLTHLRSKLQQLRATAPLFDTRRFVRNLERAFHTMWQTHASGKPPQAFAVREG